MEPVPVTYLLAHLQRVQCGEEHRGDVCVGRLLLVTPQPQVPHRRLAVVSGTQRVVDDNVL